MQNRRAFFLRNLFFLSLVFLLPACNPVKEPPIVPLSPCKPSVKPKPPPKSNCLVYPSSDQGSSLSELVDVALHNHPLTKESWSQARSASAGVTIAESPYYPQLMGDLEASRQKLSVATIGSAAASGTGAFTAYDALLSLSYLLWDFGERSNNLMSAKETLCSASWNYSWTIQSTMINVISSYWRMIGAKANMEAAEADLEDASTLLEVSKTKKRAGLATYVDVAQAQANYVKAELNLVAAKGALENTHSTLATNIGLEPTTKFSITQPAPLEPTRLTDDLQKLVDRARCCRADLTSLRIALKAQAYAVEAQKAQLYPTLNAGGWLARVWYTSPTPSNSVDFNAALNLNYPFFSGFETVGTIKEYEANLDAQWASYKNQENNALLNVATNYTSVKTALESISYTKTYLTYAKDSFAANLKGYKSGTKSIVDVISAETTLSDARSRLVESETNYYISLANLAYTTGLLVSQEVAK